MSINIQVRILTGLTRILILRQQEVNRLRPGIKNIVYMNSYPTLITIQIHYKGKPVNFLQEDGRFLL